MANIKIISATQARNNWFEILNWVNYEKGEVLVKKNKRFYVRIIPGETPKLESLDEVLNKIYGRLANKKSYFPYEDKKIIKKEKKANTPPKLWKKK
ncbi:MAG: hypothetical protein NC935_08820 [Candidatus Omnitrophica bacterium]|nr:hypothetical protein [Candidatus Omnitrophota bacterium]